MSTCDDLRNLADQVDPRGQKYTTTIRTPSAEKGKTTLDNILSETRDLKKRELTATGDEKQRIISELATHYSEAGEKGTTLAKTNLTNSIIANSDVHEYINTMSIDDYSNLRMELQTTFGGPQARLLEIQFKDAKTASLTRELTELGKYTDAVKQELSDMKGRGILSDADLDMLRGLEDFKTFDDTTITTGTARKTYTDLKKSVGENIASETFGNKIAKDIETILDETKNPTVKQRIFKQLPNEEETKLMTDITNGNHVPDANTFEAINKILDKVSDSGWNTIRGTISPLNELDGATRTKIMQQTSKSLPSKIKDAIPWKTLGFAAIGVPTIFAVWAMQAQSGYENYFQFSSWTGKSTKDQVTGFVDRMKELEDKLIAVDRALEVYNFLTTIPFGIGEYYKYAIGISEFGLDSVYSDFNKTIQELLGKGLVKEDKSKRSGYSKAEYDDQVKIFKDDPTKLFQNDATFVGKFSDLWGEHTNVFGNDGKELTSTQVTALYLNIKEGKGLDKKLVESSGIGQNEIGEYTGLEATTTKNAILEWGDKNLKTPNENTTETKTEESTLPTMDALNQGKLNCGSGTQCTTEYIKNMKKNGFRIYQKDDGTLIWARPNEISKVCENCKVISAPIEEIQESSGGSGGSTEESKSTSTRDEYIEGIRKSKDRSYEEKQKISDDAINREENYVESMEEAGMSKTEASTLNKVAFKQSTAEYVKKNAETMSVDDIKEMQSIEKDETAKGLYATISCDQ